MLDPSKIPSSSSKPNVLSRGAENADSPDAPAKAPPPTGIKISPNTTCPNASPNANCTNPYDLVGAHVVRDKAKIKVHSGDTVYLIPLCRSCNGKTGPIIINTNVTALVLTI